MSSNTSMSPPPIETLVEAPTSSSKAAKGKKVASKKATSKTAAKASSHPSWKEIVKACIVFNKEDSRSGVSRSTIKKYAEETYGIDVTGTNLYQLNRAITTGVEAGIFALPKGPSGKVKLAPKAKPVADGAKENSKPPSTKKVAPASKKADAAPKKAAVTTKKPAAAAPKKATTTKKVTTTAKKAVAPAAKKAAPAKKVTAGAPAKKPTKSTAPAKKASTAKTTEKKKVAAKAAATKAAKKPVAKAKPASRSRRAAA
ncbi:hypothetical protein HYDPIDRAFT_106085 [Hydnomerulius pinastri MD-312]|nr:hypothetical protein HYDPIDRAFT_106085 [Hydnomerulius pinastri MD-312]